MTVAQNDRYIPYAPAAATTVMAYDFQIFNENDIAVDRLRAGTKTTLTITTDYTVSGVGVLGGGNITLVTGSTAGDIYAIYGVNEYRSADYTQSGDFLAADVNNDMNKQMQVSQQLRRDVDTSIRLSTVDSSFSTANLTIPVLASRLSKYLAFDSSGDLTVSSGTVTLNGNPDLVALGTGILKNTTVTGVLSIDASMTSLSALPTVADRIAYSTALNTWAETPLTAFGRSLIDDAAAVNARTTLGLVIGTDVQAYNATLASLAALGTVADRYAYTTALNTWAEGTITAAGRALIDDATAGDQRTTLGLGTIATQDASAVAITGGTLAGITQCDVDNIRIDLNTISSTDANGNIILDPNGTGQVAIVNTASVFDEIAAPATPAANKVIIYAKADGHIYQMDDTGTETDLTLGSSGLVAASQAEMETATSVLVASTPGRQQYHPSAAKFWVYFTTNNTAITAGYNVASLTNIATGRSKINYTVAYSTASYAVAGMVYNNVNTTACYRINVNGTPATGSIDVRTSDSGDTVTSYPCYVIGFGDQ